VLFSFIALLLVVCTIYEIIKIRQEGILSLVDKCLVIPKNFHPRR
jgi:hypothetical protein